MECRGGQWCSVVPVLHASPMLPPCSLHFGSGELLPSSLYDPPQVVFSFHIVSLLPVAKGPKPISAKGALVLVFADPMRLYICFHFQKSHLLQLVPGISYLGHWSVAITDSDQSLSLLLASPTSCPWCVYVLQNSGKAICREKNRILGGGSGF